MLIWNHNNQLSFKSHNTPLIIILKITNPINISKINTSNPNNNNNNNNINNNNNNNNNNNINNKRQNK